ncbi:MAG: BON domain-containing protein [Thermoanaerobacteraceae bacterium]
MIKNYVNNNSFDNSDINNILVQNLSKYDLNIPDLIIVADNGIINLIGSVKNQQEMNLVIKAAKNIKGTKKVINNLTVRKKS